MTISLFLMSNDLKSEQFIGTMEYSYFDKIKSCKNSKLALLSNIDPYDFTYFNKKQLHFIKEELHLLQQFLKPEDDQFALFSQSIKKAIDQSKFTFLVLVGD